MNSPLLYVAEASTGGIAEYSRHQIRALMDIGVDVRILCRPDYPGLGDFSSERVIPILPTMHQARSRIGRAVGYLRDSLAVASLTKQEALRNGCAAVLLDCFREYLAPFWVGPLKALDRQGVTLAVVAHDPIRDFRVGPLWWHRFSIRSAYRPITHVFVHDSTEIDFGGSKPDRIQVHEIPHGPYEMPPPVLGREKMREQLGFKDSDRVFLSFGQIRDGKNLDRFIEAMEELPENVKLLVAGSGGARSQRPPQYYMDLAERLGLSERCVWRIEYIPDNEVTDYFAAADFLLLTYSSDFRSASGVLNIAVNYQLPCLASGGEGPLKTAVTQYDLGEWIDELNERTLSNASRALLSGLVEPKWFEFVEDHSWLKNTSRLFEVLS